jgi:outer membrane protein
MRLITITIGLILSLSLTVSAQQKWNLQTCVEYAMAHNLGVTSSSVQAKISALTLKQSQLSRYPGLNLGMNTAFNSGNNQDPTTFNRVTENYLSAGFQLQTSADVFNFFSKRNTIAANEWNFMAAKAGVSKVAYDIALSTANAYLQILLAMQQEDITKVQIQQTQFQLTNTRKMVDAGSLPELNATQLEAQLAADSGNYISAKGNVSQATLLCINSYGFWWTISIVFGEVHASNRYFAYLITAFLFNLIEFISTIYCAVQTRKGIHVQQWFFGNLTNLICRSDVK